MSCGHAMLRHKIACNSRTETDKKHSFVTRVLSAVSAAGNTRIQSSLNFGIFAFVTFASLAIIWQKTVMIHSALWQTLMSSHGTSASHHTVTVPIIVPTCTATEPMGIGLPPHSTYKQSFNFQSTVLPEILLDEKNYLQSPIHPLTELAQFDTEESQLCWWKLLTVCAIMAIRPSWPWFHVK